MTLRSSDLQSDSDLDSIRNSCDVFSLTSLINCCWTKPNWHPFYRIWQSSGLIGRYSGQVYIQGTKYQKLSCWNAEKADQRYKLKWKGSTSLFSTEAVFAFARHSPSEELVSMDASHNAISLPRLLSPPKAMFMSSGEETKKDLICYF